MPQARTQSGTRQSRTTLHTSRRFTGLDLYNNPGDLGEGALTQADNLLLVGGSLVTRPGFAGQWTTPLTGPLYGGLDFVGADGTTQVLFTSGSKLYRHVKGAAAPVEVLSGAGASLSVSSPTARFARASKYAYVADGVHALLRTDLTTGSTVTALNAPTNAPVSTLTGRVLDAFNTVAGWSASSLPAGAANNQLPDNGQFTTWTVNPPNTPGGGWTPDNLDGSIDLDFVNADAGNPSEKYIRLDDSGDQFHLTTAVVNAQVQELGTGTGRYAQGFALSGRLKADYITDSVDVTLLVYSDTGGATLLAAETQKVSATTTGTVQNWSLAFSFADVDTPIRSWRTQYRAGTGNHAGNNGPYLGHLSAAPTDAGVTFALSGGQVGVMAPDAGGVVPLGGVRLIHDFGANKDLSAESHIAIGLTQTAIFTGLAGTLGLRTAAGSTVYSNPLTLTADGKTLTVDISTLAASDRAAVRYMELVLTSDLSLSSGGGGVLFALGPLTAAGNLSVGYADYQCLFTEEDENGDYPALINVIDSGESPVGNSVTPTATMATETVKLPAKANAGAQRFTLYRKGGTFSDGLARRLCSFRFDGTGAADTNPYVSYDAATQTVTDNTPDSYLLLAETLTTGRVPPPVGAQAVCAWQGRLWLAKGSTLYASDLLDEASPDGLYFRNVNLLNAADAAIQGARFSLGGADNDPIQNILAYGTALVVLKQRSVWLVAGFDAATWSAQSYLLKSGVGLVAPQGAALILNHVWLTGADGLYQFDADIVDPKSVPIDVRLHPATSSPAGYAGVSLFSHNRRLWALAPDGAGTTNSVAWVWDSRVGASGSGWTRLTNALFTGGVTLTSGTDSSDLFLFGQDGQLYTLTGTADKASPSAAGTPVAWACLSRACGQEGDGMERWREKACGHVSAQADASSGPVTLSVTNEHAASWTQARPAGSGLLRARVPAWLRGARLTAGLSGTGTARVDALLLETTARTLAG